MKIIEKLKWLRRVGIAHAMLHPDSSMYTFRKAGCNCKKSIVLAITGSSIGTLLLVAGNMLGIYLVDIGLNFQFINWISPYLAKLINTWGYSAIALLTIVPYAPFVKEVTLITGQAAGLYYAFPLMLLANALRIIVLFSLTFRRPDKVAA